MTRTVVSFRWRTTATDYIRRTTMVGFARRKNVASFRWRTTAMGYRPRMSYRPRAVVVGFN